MFCRHAPPGKNALNLLRLRAQTLRAFRQSEGFSQIHERSNFLWPPDPVDRLSTPQIEPMVVRRPRARERATSVVHGVNIPLCSPLKKLPGNGKSLKNPSLALRGGYKSKAHPRGVRGIPPPIFRRTAGSSTATVGYRSGAHIVARPPAPKASRSPGRITRRLAPPRSGEHHRAAIAPAAIFRSCRYGEMYRTAPGWHGVRRGDDGTVFLDHARHAGLVDILKERVDIFVRIAEHLAPERLERILVALPRTDAASC